MSNSEFYWKVCYKNIEYSVKLCYYISKLKENNKLFFKIPNKSYENYEETENID